MSITFSTLNTEAGFAADVGGVDLSQPMDEATFLPIRDGLDQYGVLVFHDQDLDEEAQIAFSRHFGELEVSIRRHRARAVAHDEISDITNVAPDGSIYPIDGEHMSYNLGNQLWHADSSFKAIPALVSLLHAREVPPEDGATEFADQRAAWDGLSAETQARIDGMVGMHSLAHSRAAMGYDAEDKFLAAEKAEVPPVPQALVQTNPRTGRKALYAGAHVASIVGLNKADSDALLEELRAQATQDSLLYHHDWQPGDLVIWDDRATLHRGRPFDNKYRRVMRRTTVAGDRPTA
ncbi:MAG: TauD/TfdA family dioxygenase [Rhodospirillaceae bacterium]|jgi:alpha-ketoglutarate-dependent 2,4-dichlorophenoxyacetate dioxygenase|nr:TauD/TfdA family dioxygenase [Rhodospirillaceae bacterium]MBT4046390.1 TauD/TfdA family dioxygenase [Rhodospirillaceae bacterium]MBT4688265.1 TauD/TfdA family dioxygenase [Rhodospirillaceae bacterium]MBT5079258.1 TauD/TfdA family dioxygenase [Rhodospirillaceae bacterium]MBT5522458.1 TauD/TfdA family dioxygenase [Rhodospirillaceae bacterium]